MNKRINIKVILCYLAILMSIVYLLWRIMYTIPSPKEFRIIDFSFAMLLLMAELLGIISGIGMLIGLGRDYNPEFPDTSIIPKEWYPNIDVFIATHNESVDLLFKTVNGCNNMDYPDKSKVHIYICDDTNRPEVEKLAKEMGIGYFGLKENKAAKAGNLNNAIYKTSSPLIVTFDSDMIPKHTFLMRTVPYFFLPKLMKNKEGKWEIRKDANKNLKIGFIQTPQNFYNADLFQYNLYLENYVPNEQNYFFREVNIMRNKNNTPIYAGSNTVISREALKAIGGVCEGLITEDFATGALIQSKGYTCYGVRDAQANGLSPDDLKSLVKQRERWSRGVIQTFRKLHLWFLRGLTFPQKFSYFMCMLYWYTPLARLMYILSPILFLLFDIVVVNCTIKEVVLGWLPYYLIFITAVKLASTGIRTTKLSNLYDTIMCPYLIIPVLLETLGIKQKKFLVTKKDKKIIDSNNKRYIVFPLIMFILNLLGLLKAGLITYESKSYIYLVGIIWAIVNGYHLIMAIFFVIGRKMFRMTERFKVSIPITLKIKEKVIKSKTLDISENGFAILLDFPEFIDNNELISVTCKTNRYYSMFKCKVVQVVKVNNKWKYSFIIKDIDINNKKQYYSIIYDRDPSYPEKIQRNLTPIKEIFINIKGRTKRNIQLNRKLPRIICNKEIKTNNKINIFIYNFNYKYILLGCEDWNKAPMDKIEILLDNSVNIKCEYDSIISDRKRLYKVINYEDLIKSDEFRNEISNWDNNNININININKR